MEINKFFFCIPLKVVLTLYGYLNLVWTCYEMTLHYARCAGTYSYYYMYEFSLTLYVLLFCMFVIESIFTIVFINGIYMNYTRTLKIFFWYKMVSLEVFLCFAINKMNHILPKSEDQEAPFEAERPAWVGHYLTTTICYLGITTGMLIYVLVALRSYYMKLEHDLTKDADALNRSTNNLILAGETLRDDFAEFTNETSAKSLRL